MTNTLRYNGICHGGLLDGEYLEYYYPYYRVAVLPALDWKPLDPLEAPKPPPHVEYVYRGGAWWIQT